MAKRGQDAFVRESALHFDRDTATIPGKTFRLSNMGDETEETVAHLLRCLDDVLD